MLADAGIPLGSQTVLLKGMNDSGEVMKRLVHSLMKMRVKPYYLYQCDPISGSEHFYPGLQRRGYHPQPARGHTSGYAVPTYVIDAPGGGGRNSRRPRLRGGNGHPRQLAPHQLHEGGTYQYPDYVAE